MKTSHCPVVTFCQANIPVMELPVSITILQTLLSFTASSGNAADIDTKATRATNANICFISSHLLYSGTAHRIAKSCQLRPVMFLTRDICSCSSSVNCISTLFTLTKLLSLSI